MKDEFEEDQVQFRMAAEDRVEETPQAMDVEELRLEKISQRVTFISILIPVLIIIVLVIAYLDIKKRMSYTEDTGTMEFQKLSSDLESRFSSLSLRQAKLEDNLANLNQTNNQTLAGIHIKLDKTEKSLEAIEKKMAQLVDQKEFKSVRDDLTQKIKDVAGTIDQTDSQITSMTQELNNEIAKIGATINDRNLRLDRLEHDTKELEINKIDQPALDLKMKLATLKIEQELMAEMEQLRTDIRTVAARVDQLSARPAPNPSAAKPGPMESPTKSTEPPKSNSKIEEQTISP